jgi:hypothetical protein
MMRRLAFVLLILTCCVGPSIAQEAVTLTAPASVGTRSTWSVNYLHIDLLPSPRIVVEVQDNLGNVVRDEHTATTTTTAATLLATLNTKNLSTAGNSLVATLLKHLQAEGKIAAGSVTGTPQ